MSSRRPGDRLQSLADVVCNPFHVLGLTPAARHAEVSLRYRALGEALRKNESVTFDTPHGRVPLDAALLARAYRALTDADRRLEHELRYVPLPHRRARLAVVKQGTHR